MYEPSHVAGLVDSHINPEREAIVLIVPQRRAEGDYYLLQFESEQMIFLHLTQQPENLIP